VEIWIAAATAGLLTLFDLDKKFYVPSNAPSPTAKARNGADMLFSGSVSHTTQYKSTANRLLISTKPHHQAYNTAFPSQDQVLTDDEKRSRKAWMLRVLQDASTTEDDKKKQLADFLLSGQASADLA
jgi:hypothetical protein